MLGHHGQSSELNYVIDTLEHHDLSRYNKIAVIQPAYSSFGRYDEFGVFTTVFSNDVGVVIKCAAYEAGKSKDIRVFIKSLSILPARNEKQIDASTPDF